MSGSGELIQLLYDAHSRLQGMSLEVDDWTAREPSQALIFQTGRGVTGPRARWMGGGPAGTPLVGTRRIWFEPPNRVRVEIRQGNATIRAAVRDGANWWRWDAQEGEVAGNLEAGGGVPPMLDVVQIDPAKLLSSMWLDVTGRGERVSRDVLSAGAVPRLLPAAQRRRFEFEFDREHGTPLYAATFEAEELTRVAAVRAIEYGPVDPSVFQFTVTRDAGEPLPAPAFSGRRPPLKRTSRDTSVSPPPIVAAHPTIWLTGIPSAGKTTIARATERLLHQLGVHCCILDGDELRDGLSCDLGLTRPDRREQARRAAHIAALVAQSGVVPIVALVSPYAEDRAFARDIHEAHAVGFLEVWVDTPLEICAGRDPKGLYAATYAAAASDRHEDVDGSGLTGVSAPYEPPRHPDLTVRGDTGSARNAASQIVEALISRRPGTYVFTTR